MRQIKQILRFAQQGKSIKFIARNLFVSRNTVHKYLLLHLACDQPVEKLLQLEQALLSISPPVSDTRYQDLLERYDYFCKELRRTLVAVVGVPAKLFQWQLLQSILQAPA